MKRILSLLLPFVLLFSACGSAAAGSAVSAESYVTEISSSVVSEVPSVEPSPSLSPVPSPSPSPDSAALDYFLDQLSQLLDDDIYEYSVNGDTVEIISWEDDVTNFANAAVTSKSVRDNWYRAFSSLPGLVDTFCQMRDMCGASDYHVSMSMVSEKDHSIPLYTVVDGEVTYDYVAEQMEILASRPSPSPDPVSAGSFEAPTLPAFDGLSYSGSGDTVLSDVVLPEGAIYYAYFSHSGRGNFVIRVYDGSGKYDLAANEIGNYSGFYLFESNDVSDIEITAGGSWTVSIAQLTFDPDADSFSGFFGSGDYVSYITPTSGGTWNLSHSGSGNFIVYAYDTDGTKLSSSGRKLLVNEIGTYSGQKIFRPSKNLLLYVQANGDWSMTLAE